jgi:thiamine kinase-like enzyme
VAIREPIAIAAALPCWSGPVSPTPLSGGMTNANFVVEDAGRRYVARIGGDIPAHLIQRSAEAAVCRAAHEAGVSPAVRYADSHALVIDFIEGRTFEPHDVRASANHWRLIGLVRSAHRNIPKYLRGPPPLFWVFQVVRHYGHLLRELDSPHVVALADFARNAAALERAVGPIELIFGHNDLLAANIIDDGKRLWLVDWEYAGFNSALFDLGGLASNNQVSPDGADSLAELYFERVVDHALRRRMAAMAAASLLRETLWSMVSEHTSALGFDYAAYTAQNMGRFVAAYAAFEKM